MLQIPSPTSADLAAYPKTAILEARIELIDETIEALLAHRQTLCVQIVQHRTTATATAASASAQVARTAGVPALQ